MSPKKHPRPARPAPVRGLSTAGRPDNTRRCLIGVIANAKTLGERGEGVTRLSIQRTVPFNHGQY
jgi:hypothetical protein